MRKSIRNLNNLSSGNQLRQGDESFLVYEIIADGSLANSTARVRLYKGESVYLDVNTDIKNGNLVEFSVATLPVGQYIVEIAVNGYKYPSHEFETINIIPSADGYVKKSESVDLDKVVNSVLKRLPEAQAEVIRTDVAWADDFRYASREIKQVKGRDDDYYFPVTLGKRYSVDYLLRDNAAYEYVVENNFFIESAEGEGKRNVRGYYNPFDGTIQLMDIKKNDRTDKAILGFFNFPFIELHLGEVLPDKPLEFSGFTTDKPKNKLFSKAIGFRQTTGEVSQNPHDYNWTVLR